MSNQEISGKGVDQRDADSEVLPPDQMDNSTNETNSLTSAVSTSAGFVTEESTEPAAEANAQIGTLGQSAAGVVSPSPAGEAAAPATSAVSMGSGFVIAESTEPAAEANAQIGTLGQSAAGVVSPSPAGEAAAPAAAVIERTLRLQTSRQDKDQRRPFQRDRDRVLYSSAFRRLGGVTQVVAPEEGHIFHNRLTHTLKVAQIGRRIAEMICERQPDEAAHLQIDPDVVEAACLAHDLGHPPFGHIAEEELNDLMVTRAKCFDGYEGNAQSFRIVTKLSPRDRATPGLNLTRATLNAILKYPWFREEDGKKSRKWGAYQSEKTEFEFARSGSHEDIVGIEAQLMTWADDISYAVHDTEDFFRARLIPLDRLATKSCTEAEQFLSGVKERKKLDDKRFRKFERAFLRLRELFPSEPYRGKREDRYRLTDFGSSLISNYVKATTVRAEPDKEGRFISVDPQLEFEIEMLQQLTWHYVINNPSLASQQYGQRQIIRGLFQVFSEALEPGRSRWHLLPPLFQSEMEALGNIHGRRAIPVEARNRVVCDTIASMSDIEAFRVYQRITGVLPGSVLDPIIA